MALRAVPLAPVRPWLDRPHPIATMLDVKAATGHPGCRLHLRCYLQRFRELFS